MNQTMTNEINIYRFYVFPEPKPLDFENVLTFELTAEEMAFLSVYPHQFQPLIRQKAIDLMPKGTKMTVFNEPQLLNQISATEKDTLPLNDVVTKLRQLADLNTNNRSQTLRSTLIDEIWPLFEPSRRKYLS